MNIDRSTLFAQGGIFPVGDMYSLQTPSMESTTYITNTPDRLLPIDAESLVANYESPFEGLYYGGVDTPTTKQAAQQIAQMEKGEHAVLTPSGQSALHLLLLALLKPGDHVLVGDTVIYTTRWLLEYFKQKGMAVEYFAPQEAHALRTKLRSHTRVVLWETPGAYTYELIDSAAVIEACNHHPTLMVVDNTWSASTFSFPLEMNVDICILSLSKSLAAVEGVSLGALITRRPEIFKIFKQTSALIGNHVSSHVCAAALRSISTLAARLHAQQLSTVAVIKYLEMQHSVVKVLHPLVQHSVSELAKYSIDGYNSLITVQLTHEKKTLVRQLGLLRVIRIGYGWGGTVSLATPIVMDNNSSAQRMNITGTCIRLYIGLEHPNDLISDLRRAFFDTSSSLRKVDQ
ncbi:cystathionine beta-lyase [Pseudomonas sp. S60]|uniref:PLP-dependent transferase n=1 Tax=Pseudomonas sp. S60 TaxID=211124 RepID=UPI001F3B9969|nr:PLP-dependent transferase [Pseudomonas sp. S60]MBK5012303.1 cystathionine beta-lyase [Pseudomonas sp. S60]